MLDSGERIDDTDFLPPATEVAITVGEGKTQKIIQSGGTFTGSPAGNALHVHALNLWPEPDLNTLIIWNFGCPDTMAVISDPISRDKVDLNTQQQGSVAAYVYNKAGTYTITMSIYPVPGSTLPNLSHPSQKSTITVVIPPPNRQVYFISNKGKDSNPGTQAAPFLTPHLNLLKANCELSFERGGTYILGSGIPFQNRNVFISSWGAGALPILTMQNGGSFCGTWTTSSDHYGMSNIRLKGHGTPAVSGDGIPYAFGDANGGFLRGEGATFVNVEVDTLNDGIKGSADLHGGYFQGITQVSDWGIRGRTLWEEGQDVVVVGCRGTNSTSESTNRAADSGVIRASHCWNYWSQLFKNPASPVTRSGAKAAFTHRQIWYEYIYRNKIVDGNMSFDPHTNTVYDRYVDCRENDLSGNSQIEIKANTWDSAFRWNHIVTKYIGFSVRPDNEGNDSKLTMENVRIQYNNITAGSNDVDMYVHDPARLTGYVESDNTWSKP